MFERRRRAIAQMSFYQSQRSLRSGEHIPPLPGLADQIVACRAEMARSHRLDEIPEPPPMAEEGDELAF
ncbi:hypothetical protein ACDA63_00680 [Uliginosibacterium sp. sgz301328]|uniref:hypothetical protein n=1 Tax=Uliginosibacterium sp. sgz301328 TaxID=3243764 RepID=UPI00359E4F25